MIIRHLKRWQMKRDNINFKVIKHSDYERLSQSEKEDYLAKYRFWVKNDYKPQCLTKGATTTAPKLLSPTRKVAEWLVKTCFVSRGCEWIVDGLENIPNTTCLFAHTHQGVLDGFVSIPYVKQRCIVLHSDYCNKGLILAQLNTGLILINKADLKCKANSKLDAIHLLSTGFSLAWFPEGAWNLSPNKLHLPMSYGFLDAARIAKVPVIPACHEYSYEIKDGVAKITKIHTKFASPMIINDDDNLRVRFSEYTQIISTLRYEMIEEKGLFQRSLVDDSEYITVLNKQIKDLKFGNIPLARERKYIFGADNVFYEDHFINEVEYRDGKLLPHPQKFVPSEWQEK